MIDRDHLDRQTAGDTVLQRDVLVLFAGQMQDLDRLLAGVDAMAGTLAEALHRARGAAAGVGAVALVDRLAVAERHVEAGKLPHRETETLRAVIAATLGEVDRLIAAPPSAGLAKDGESV